jgi:hypothetical protein
VLRITLLYVIQSAMLRDAVLCSKLPCFVMLVSCQRVAEPRVQRTRHCTMKSMRQTSCTAHYIMRTDSCAVVWRSRWQLEMYVFWQSP